MKFLVQFDEKNHPRIDGKIAFASKRGPRPSDHSIWECSIEGQNPKGTVYFLELHREVSGLVYSGTGGDVRVICGKRTLTFSTPEYRAAESEKRKQREDAEREKLEAALRERKVVDAYAQAFHALRLPGKFVQRDEETTGVLFGAGELSAPKPPKWHDNVYRLKLTLPDFDLECEIVENFHEGDDGDWAHLPGTNGTEGQGIFVPLQFEFTFDIRQMCKSIVRAIREQWGIDVDENDLDVWEGSGPIRYRSNYDFSSMHQWEFVEVRKTTRPPEINLVPHWFKDSD